MTGAKKTLYERLGGYDAITAVANDLLPRLQADPQLGRFWAHRGEDGVKREKQLLIDFLCASAGGPVYYRGRDMALTHRGMRISESDWNVFLGHAAATLAKFRVPKPNSARWSRLSRVSRKRSSNSVALPPPRARAYALAGACARVRADASDFALERPAGSHALAAAAHRGVRRLLT